MIRFLKTSLSIALLSTSVSVFAQTLEECPDLLARAEAGESFEFNPYDFCGFDDEKTAWEKWAAYASQQNFKKALFELCERWPNHIYHNIYCEKSATLGYGPALAYKAQNLIQKGDAKAGLSWATEAIETNELNEEQTGRLLEVIGVHYYKTNNPKYREYLEQAAVRRSALANHILGTLTYTQYKSTPETEKAAFMKMWRAILLGCPNAEENLGLFHLARQKKIPQKTAIQMMSEKITSCEVSSDSDKNKQINEELYSCRCKAALENEKRFKEKPYLLLSVSDGGAELQDSTGLKYNVAANSNLPNQGTVAEIRKTAVIITYPQKRVIINLYKQDDCVAFCNKHQITENLSPVEMKKKILGDENIVIKPYYLTFTPQECETLTYYAKHLVDTSLPYIGKEECSKPAKTTKETDVILSHISGENLTDEPIIAPNTEPRTDEKPQISDETKERIKSFGSDVLGIE